MPRRYRQITLLLFVVAFLIIAPIVILYTQGYRYNFKRGTIQKTGILIVSSSPRRADILLNGELVDRQTPAKLERVLPGDYEITLQREGYHDWTKRLTIFDNATTFAEDILLFRQSLPQLVTSQSLTAITISPDRSLAALVFDQRNLSLMNMRTGTILPTDTGTATGTIEHVEWSASNHKALVKFATGTTTSYFIIDTGRANSDPTTIPSTFEHYHWDMADDTILYGSRDSEIWRYDTTSGAQRLATRATSTATFTAKSGVIYTTDSATVYRHATDGTVAAVGPARCSSCEFIQRPGARLILHDPTALQLYSIDPTGQHRPISISASHIDWLSESVALIANPWELWIYSIDQTEPELITRVSDPIQYAVWHPAGRHIVYASANHVRVIELDDRETRLTTDLATFDALSSLIPLTSGNALYISGAVSSSSGLFQLDL